MFSLSPIDWIILLTYFAVVALIGIVASRLVRNREDFVMGGRRFGKLMTTFFAFGAGTHADSATGVASQSYKVGFAGFWYQGVMIFTLPIYWLLVPVFRRARVQTTADFFERRFGTGFMLLYALFALFLMVAFSSTGLYGTAKLIEALLTPQVSFLGEAGANAARVGTGASAEPAGLEQLPLWQLVIPVVAIISFLYAIAGGLVAAVWNDFLQGILTIVMSVLIIPFFWHHVGGLDGFQAKLDDPEQAFRLVLDKDMTLFWIVMVSINSLFSMVVQPHIMANAGSAATEMDSRVGFVGGLVLKRLMTIPWALTGVMAIALFGQGTIAGDHAFGDTAQALLPVGFVGLMIACVMASIMDNLAVFMISFAATYTNSIHLKIWPRTPERRLVLTSRLASIAFAVLVIPLSYAFTDIPSAMRFMFQTVPIMGVSFFLAILWPRANRYGAVASFAAALLALLVAKYYFGWQGDAGLPATITLYLSVGIFAGWLISVMTPPEEPLRTRRFFLLIRTPVGQEAALRTAGMIEQPGTGTFSDPGTGTAHDLERAERSLILTRARRESLHGFVWLTFIAIGLIALVWFLSRWLATG